MYEEVFLEHNLEKAYRVLEEKKLYHGIDGVEFLDFKDYLILNWKKINKQLLDGTYKPHAVMANEILTKRRKKRIVYQYSIIDQYIQKAIEIHLNEYFNPLFSDRNLSYRKGMGIYDVLNYALIQIKDGYEYILEVDIKKFFETIDHEILKKKLSQYLHNQKLEELIMSFQQCDIVYDGSIKQLAKGLITGSSLSPLLSNVYLNEFDNLFINEKYVRYSDNIFFFCKTEQDGMLLLSNVEKLICDLNLEIHPDKTKVSFYMNCKMLGHEFTLENGMLGVKRDLEKNQKYYSKWHTSSIKQVSNMYHILNEGILIRKDYSLLFENEELKQNIPIETTKNINIFSNITFSSEFFKMMNQKKIRVAVFDEYSNFVGAFVPKNSTSSADTLLKQVTLYNDEVKRLEIATIILTGAFKNIVNFLKFHNRRYKNEDLTLKINIINNTVTKFKDSSTIAQLMALEARAREVYYSCFNYIIKQSDFTYQKRTKRPPKDALNAMISFGNTLIYQLIASELYRTSLDIRISYLHSSKRRYENLNLDLAEIFKPIVIDRMVFSLINRKEIDAKLHFEHKNNGVYLNKEGKRIFLNSFMNRINQRVIYGGERIIILYNHTKGNKKFFKYDSNG